MAFLEQKPTQFVFVGRLIYAKGVQDLIQAFIHFPQHHEDRLVIVGDGNYRAALEHQAQQNWRGETIVFRGELGREGVMDVLAASDVFVNPSYSEGLPTSILEAASVGLPIIATDVGGTREIVTHGETGILVVPRDVRGLVAAMEVMSTNRVWAQQLGANARRVVRDRFSWGVIMHQWAELLQEVIT